MPPASSASPFALIPGGAAGRGSPFQPTQGGANQANWTQVGRKKSSLAALAKKHEPGMVVDFQRGA
eukprot:15072268-Alexandrium_andersonii.AAC.1